MAGPARFEGFGGTAGHDDLLCLHFHVNPGAIHLVLVGVGGIDLLDDEVLRVGRQVGDAPGDVVVVSDDHTRCAREGEPGHVERAAVRGTHTVQGHLEPDRRHLDGQVRVVGEDRRTGLGLRTRHHPVVRADLGTGDAGEVTHSLDLLRQVREAFVWEEGQGRVRRLRGGGAPVDDHRLVVGVRRPEFFHPVHADDSGA